MLMLAFSKVEQHSIFTFKESISAATMHRSSRESGGSGETIRASEGAGFPVEQLLSESSKHLRK